MKHYLIAVAALALAGCNGGSATAPPVNTGTAAPTSTPKTVYALRWTGATHSTQQSVARHALDVANTTEPIELAVGAPGSLVRQSGAVFGTLQVTATVGGSPAPVPVPSPGVLDISSRATRAETPRVA